MTDNNESQKKMSLQEAIKQQLENKKNQAAGGKGTSNPAQKNQKMQSQLTKKPSNTRRKMGS